MFFTVKDSFYSIRQIHLKVYIPLALDITQDPSVLPGHEIFGFLSCWSLS